MRVLGCRHPVPGTHILGRCCGMQVTSRTTMAWGYIGRMSLDWEPCFGSWPQPFPGTGWFSWKVHPWHMHICRPLIHRPKSKNLQLLGKNQQWFSLLQNVAISHLGLDPSPCIISVGHEPSSARVHLQAKTQSHMIFIMLRKVMQFKTF